MQVIVGTERRLMTSEWRCGSEKREASKSRNGFFLDQGKRKTPLLIDIILGV
jgi:hypothetical protein